MQESAHPPLDRADLELLLAIRRSGSLAAAAQALGIAASAVTRRLAALEGRLRLKLFHRTTRRVLPTPEAEALCEQAERVIAAFRDLEQALGERQDELSGTLRLAATFGFGRLWVGPALADFQALHPRLSVELQLTETLPDLAAEGFDGAVWLWSVQGARAAQWSGRRLAANRRVLVASPGYLAAHGTPLQPEDLARHDCLLTREHEQRVDQWSLVEEHGGTELRVPVRGKLASNSGELVRDWCLAGRGIMLRSAWDIAAQLASGELVRLLPGYAMLDADIHWLAPHRPQVPKRIRLLVDFLAQRFATQPWLA